MPSIEGLLGDLQFERGDIGWANLFDTPDRRTFMGFTDWYSLDSFCPLVPKEKSYPKALALILPFDAILWSLVIIFVLMGIITLFIFWNFSEK